MILLAFRDITERKQAERTTSLLAGIVGSSDDAIVSENLDGRITSWNTGAEHTFGYKAHEAIGQHITLIIPPDRWDEETDILRRIANGERVNHFETVRTRKDGALLNISATISPVRDAAGRVIGASKVARDVTERRRVERAIAEQARLLDLSFDAIFVRDAEDRITYWNNGASRLYGFSREEALARVSHDLLHTEFPDRLERIIEQLQRDGRWSGELTHKCKDGTSVVVASRWALDRSNRGNQNVILETNSDITRQKQSEKVLRESEERFRTLAEALDAQVQLRTQELEERNWEVLEQSEQLRELSNRLLQTQDDERRHIARELHDSAGQLISVLAMSLASVDQNVAQDPKLAKALNPKLAKALKDSQDLLQQLNSEIRTMSYLLHPPLLDASGLPGAIRWYTQGVTERSGLQIDLNITQNFGRLPGEIELALFRIMQEGLTNVHRHSGSKKATIRIAREADGVSLEIEDEGRGISPERLARIQRQGSGVGITGIRERIRHFGGLMNIQSCESGTRISVMIPTSVAAVSAPETTSRETKTAG
jgi:PAS domain S-box-containing protein